MGIETIGGRIACCQGLSFILKAGISGTVSYGTLKLEAWHALSQTSLGPLH